MMRKIENNVEEIYIQHRNILPDGKKFLLEHTSRMYEGYLLYIHHVDTYLRDDKYGKSWRIQGYINNSDIQKINEYYAGKHKPHLDSILDFGEDCIELWNCTIPYNENARELAL